MKTLWTVWLAFYVIADGDGNREYIGNPALLRAFRNHETAVRYIDDLTANMNRVEVYDEPNGWYCVEIKEPVDDCIFSPNEQLYTIYQISSTQLDYDES